MDDEILKTVQSIFGTGVKIVDCEKTSSVRQEEVLLINGIPVQLGGSDSNDADAIKAALLTGQMPSVELLNQVLYKAGLLRKSVQLETSLSVKSSMTTKEEVSVVQDGRVLDERITETRENYTHQSNKNEVFQPRLPKKQKAYAFAAGISSPKRAEMKRRESLEPCRSTTFAVFAGEGETCSDIACVGRHTSDDKISTRQATDAGNLCGSSCIYNSNTVSSLASTLSNYSINLTESSNVTTLASAASDLSALSNHTINSDFTTEDFCKRSSCSYDSGHDGVSYSASDRSPNSLLSYSDLLSSTLRSAAADEGTKPVESSTQNLEYSS